MPETTITVQGGHDAYFPAERATVTVAIAFEGAERAAVVTGTTEGTAALVAGIRDRHDPERGPVTWFASDRIQVWSHRPFNDKGEQVPLVHHAQTTTRVKFRDFDELVRWVERAAAHPGVRIDGIEWTLTEATRQGAVAAVRTRAVEEARAKAQTYAEALGLTNLRCVAIADPGLLGDAGGAVPQPAAYSRMAADAGGLAFTPEDIAVSAAVDARFLAD